MEKSPHSENLKEDGSNYSSGGYKKACNTSDVCVCKCNDGQLSILMIKRAYPPFRDHWAIPGGFLDVGTGESLLEAAVRELKEETGVSGLPLTQLRTYSDPGRDPRDRIISTVYYTAVSPEVVERMKIDPEDAEVGDYCWLNINNPLTDIAFDHGKIINNLNTRIIDSINYSDGVFDFINSEFTLREIQNVYETILNRKVVTSNFRRTLMNIFVLEATGNMKCTKGRPAQTYKYLGRRSNF